MSAPPETVLVVGAGVIGSAVAMYLARAGRTVTVLAAHSTPPATLGSFGWINANGAKDKAYFGLRMRAVARWHRIARENPEFPVQMTGCLDWDLDDLKATLADYQSVGYASDMIDAPGISSRVPMLANLPDTALFNRTEGRADPDHIAAAFLQAAANTGRVQVQNRLITGLETTGARITGVRTDAGPLLADQVVLAAGVSTADLLGGIGLEFPMDNQKGLLVRSSPLKIRVDPIISAKGLHFWQMPDHRIIAGEDLGGGNVNEPTEAIIKRIKKKLHGFLPRAGAFEIEEHRITARPMPGDGRPAIGPVPHRSGLYVLCMHSGVTLAPLIGQLAAQQICENQSDPDLAAYATARFFTP